MPRRVLHMVTTTAIRHCPDMKRLHRQLVERGQGRRPLWSPSCAGRAPHFNSIELARWTACVGSGAISCGACLVENSNGFKTGRAVIQMIAMLPMAFPGMVLGLANAPFLQQPGEPAEFHLRHNGDPGDLHDHALPFRVASDGRDAAETDECGV